MRGVKKVRRLKRAQLGGTSSRSLPLINIPNPAVPFGTSSSESANEPIKYNPFFKTEEERAAYEKRLEEVADDALGWGNDKDFLRFTSYHPEPNAYDCINGVCGLNIKAGLAYSHPTDEDRYLGNPKFTESVQAGQEDYYQAYKPRIGSHLQVLDDKGKPYHSMLVYKIERDEQGKPKAYHVIHNGGGTKFMEEEISAADMADNLRTTKSPHPYMIAWNPGKYLDRGKLEKERKGKAPFPYNQSEEEVRRHFGDTYLPTSFSLRDESNLTPESPLYYLSGKDVQDQTKNTLVGLLNDKDLDRELREQLRIDDITLQNLKPYIFGIAGVENNFQNVSAGRDIKERVAEAITSNPSLGPFQIRLGSLGDRVKKAFDINDQESLKDVRKGYIGAIDRMLEAKRVMDDRVAKGYHPELEKMDPYARAVYYYNQPQKSLMSDEAWAKEHFVYSPFTIPNPVGKDWRFSTGFNTSEADMQAAYADFLNKNKLKGDRGSYMHKVLQAAYPLLMEVKDDEEPFAGIPATQLAAVEVVGKRKQQQQMGGGVSMEGYKRNSPDRFNDFNVIPSNQITMRGVDHPVLGIDDMGVRQMMLPGVDYEFPGRTVFEVPMRLGGVSDNIAKYGGAIMKKSKMMQRGGSLNQRELRSGPRREVQNDLYQYVPFGPQYDLVNGPRGIGPGGDPQFELRREMHRMPPPPPPRFHVPPIPAGRMDTMMPEHDPQLLRRAELEDWMRKRAWEAANSSYMQDGGVVIPPYDVRAPLRTAHRVDTVRPPSVVLAKREAERKVEEQRLKAMTPQEWAMYYLNDMNRSLKEQGKKIAKVNDRKRVIGNAEDLQHAYFGHPQEWSRERLAQIAQAIPYRFMLDPDETGGVGELLDNTINPGPMVGSAAEGLGMAPLRAQQADSWVPYFTAVGSPLAKGALGMDPLDMSMFHGMMNKSLSGQAANLWDNVLLPTTTETMEETAIDEAKEGVDQQQLEAQKKLEEQKLQQQKLAEQKARQQQPLAERLQLEKQKQRQQQKLQQGGRVDDGRGFSEVNNKSNFMDPYFSSPFYGYYPEGIIPEYGASSMPFAMGKPLPRRHYQDGGQPAYVPPQPPQGYAPSTAQQRAYWNRFLDYLRTKEIAGKPELDARDQNLGLSYLNEYNRLNPNAKVDPNFVKTVQYENHLIRKKNEFPTLGAPAPTLPSSLSSIYPFKALPQGYRDRPISAVDGWLGSQTTMEPYPRFTRGKSIHKADGTEQVTSYDFGENFEDYWRSMGDPALEEKYRIQPATSQTSTQAAYPVAGARSVVGTRRYGGELGRRRIGRYQPGGTYNPFYPNGNDPNAYGNFFFNMNPQWQNFSQGYKTIGRDPGPWVTQRNNELNAQAVQGMVNTPRFQQIMKQQTVTPAPILSKDSQQFQGATGPLTEEELNMEAMKGVSNNPRFQKFMQNPILSKDSKRLQGLPDHGPEPQEQKVMYMDPLYGTLAVTGMNYAGNILEGLNKKKDTVNHLGDSVGTVVPGGGDEGAYTWNQGFYRPKDYVVTQFGAVPRGPRAMAAEGGTIDTNAVDEPVAMPVDVPAYFDSEIRGVGDLLGASDLLDVSALPDVFVGDPAAGDPSFVNMPEAPTTDLTKPKKQVVSRIPEADMSVELNKNARRAFDYYVNTKKLSPHIAAGIVGNLHRESGVDPKRHQNDGGPGRGLAQWTQGKDAKDRWDHFLAWAGKQRRNPYRLETQLDYILEEPGWGPEALKVMAATSSPEEASYAFGKSYERPSEKHAAWNIRAGVARKLYEEYLKRTNRPQLPERLPEPDERHINTASIEEGNSDMAMAAFPEVYAPTPVEEGFAALERGGEYLVTPKQLKFILANGGEVEFL